MIPNAIEGTTRRIGKSQGYIGLCIRDIETSHGPAMVSSWQPTPAEVERIAAGAPILLMVLGTGHPPVNLEAGDIPT